MKQENYNLLFLLLLVALGVVSFSFGMHQIGGFDHSAMIDTVWRIYNGALDYVDFFSPFPPAFITPIVWSTKIFGFQWYSFVIPNVILLIISGYVIYSQTYKLYGNLYESSLLALISISLTTLYIGYYWYSSVTELAILIYMLALLGYMKFPEKRSWIFVFSQMFLMTVKPNMAFVMFLFTLLPLFILEKKMRLSIVLHTFAALVLLSFLLLLNGIYIIDVAKAYLSVSGRGWPEIGMLFIFNKDDIRTYSLMLVLALVPVIAIIKNKCCLSCKGEEKQEQRVIFYIAVGGILTGLYGMLTNSEAKQLEFPIIALSVFVLTKNYNYKNLRLWLGVLSIVYIAYGLYFGYTRDRVRLIGPFYEKVANAHVSNIPFFKGVIMGDYLKGLLEDVDKYLQSSVKNDSKLFFGPRIEFCYAAFNRKSDLDMPVWWHPGTSYPIEKQNFILKSFEEKGFDVLIFAKNDYTFMPPELIAWIKRNYKEDNQFSNKLTIYTRKH